MRNKGRKYISAVVLGGVVLCALVDLVLGQKGYTICDAQGCNCTLLAGGWKNVNCHLLDDQDLTLFPDHIPDKTSEIYINNGQTITFRPRTFDSLRALSVIRFEKVQNVVFNSRALVKIASPSLLVQFFGCDDILFQSEAFDENQGSLSIEVTDSRTVKLEKSPFSNLSKCTLQNIRNLLLDSGSFEIKNLGSIGRHGPVTDVLFINIVAPEISNKVFFTSLARLSIRNSKIGRICNGAFQSSQISAIELINTTIDTIEPKALTERTLVVNFRITKCEINKLRTEAVTAGMTNLIVNHSTITEVETGAIVSTAANVEIVGNEVQTFHASAIEINKWNKVMIDQNVIINLHKDFITVPWNKDVQLITFKGNEIYHALEGSLNFLSKLDEDADKLEFDDNYFAISCSCDLADWIESLTNTTSYTDKILDTSFCKVDQRLSECFSLSIGIINMQNFTEITCVNETADCRSYNGETRTINTTGKIFTDSAQNDKQNWLIFIVVLVACFILALVSTFVVLLIRGSRWLKRRVCSLQGYFRNDYYGNNNESNDEEENTIVTVETDNEKLEIPEELTIEFLHELSQRLDDPATHQEASELIERLYEMFIIDESYENNNREEEAHLYEELGNLNLQIPPPPYEEQPSSPQSPTHTVPPSQTTTSPRGILKLMEEKVVTTNTNTEPSRTVLDVSSSSTRPILTGEYCEPIDRDVHLYSELRQKDEGKQDSVKSTGSGTMALRPLPDKPGFSFQAGPSTKL
ncbi:uncharacterized protein LOC115880274 isoform X1 [Sitophilus oryzae]|uniref:Uncharacterized protein LOC115880274 isoform X1 n=1 Tax=Sitophilus oryzae TaxID=7048 RepID=A0A6J2XRR0_SITOR|nr:uncharacterized protein LOC115880274 isoform X1 [Sitophilus oryzae]